MFLKAVKESSLRSYSSSQQCPLLFVSEMKEQSHGSNLDLCRVVPVVRGVISKPFHEHSFNLIEPYGHGD